ncbi:MAG: LysR family transcriptional regulator [Pseudomonadota bacterium]
MKDLNLLYVFEALWRDRSVTVAAERLGLTQAAVSGSLKRLRQEYDDKMFTLVGRKMQPTPLATALSNQLLDALATVRSTRGDAPGFDPASSQRMFVIRTRDIGEVVFLPAILARLRESAPKIRLRTVFRPIDETVAGLASGRIDLAMGYLPSLQNAIHRKVLCTQRYVCVMRTAHPLAAKKLTLDLFRKQEHLLVEYSGSGHLVLERALNEAGAKNRIRIRLPQYLSAPHFVTASDLLWTVPAVLAQTLAKHYPLVIKPLPIVLPDFEVALYWHDRFHRDPASQWMRDFIASQPF